MQTPMCYRHRARQEGATLVIALLILVLIMMIGITAVTTSNTQYKLAGNLQFEDGAMNNAETALATAENWLATGANFANPAFTAAGPDPAQATPQILPRTLDPTVRAARLTRPLTMAWDNTNSTRVLENDNQRNDNQRYFIELLSTNNLLTGSSAAVGRQGAAVCNKVNNYLITGRGASARGAVKYVQSFYSVLACT